MSKSAYDSWFHIPVPRPHARTRLFCFPYAGASGSAFHHWAAAMPSTVELCGIHLPGRWNRLKDISFTRVEPLVEVLDQVLCTRDDLPFLIYGHSMGALLAFELAHLRVRMERELPARLILSGRRSPQFSSHMKREIYRLPDDEFLAEIKKLNGLPDAVLDNAGLLAILLPALRADFELVNTFTHVMRPPLPIPITIFAGDADPIAPLEQIWPWTDETCNCEVHVFDGDHFFIHKRQQEVLKKISNICEAMERCLV